LPDPPGKTVENHGETRGNDGKYGGKPWLNYGKIWKIWTHRE